MPALLLVTLPLTVQADEGDDAYRLAVGAYQMARWDTAAESFETFIDEHPNHARVPLARFYWGLSLRNAEQYREAHRVLSGFVKDYPDNENRPEAMFRTAEASYLLNDLKAAEPEFKTFIQRNPRHEYLEWAWPYLADAQLRLGKPRDAAENFQEAIERFPAGRLTEDAKFGLARAQEQLKEPRKALDLYREIASDPSGTRAAEAQFNMAMLYFDHRQYTDAASAFDQLIERFPDAPQVPPARLNAGYSYYLNRDYAKAVERFDAAAKTEEQARTANYWKAFSHKSLGEFSKAADLLKALYESDPEAAETDQVLYHWADCELRLENFDTARARFLDYLERQPEGEFADESLHFAAEAALRADQLDECARLIEQFEAKFAGGPLRYHHELLHGRLLDARGEKAAADGDAKAAETHFRSALTHFQTVLDESGYESRKARARFHLARTYAHLDEHDRTIESLRPLLDLLRRNESPQEYADAFVLAATTHLKRGTDLWT
ncbi:MAG: tetratricopeptide repeat protein, partial [Planctomycetaceae bacterium]